MDAVFHADVDQGATIRTTLVDLAADNAAGVWYELKAPQRYRSRRIVNGHAVIVTIEEEPVRRESEIETMLSETSGDR